MNRSLFLVAGALLAFFGIAIMVIPYQLNELFDLDRGLTVVFVFLAPLSALALLAALWSHRMLHGIMVVVMTIWFAAILLEAAMLMTSNPMMVDHENILAYVFGGIILTNGLMVLGITLTNQELELR